MLLTNDMIQWDQLDYILGYGGRDQLGFDTTSMEVSRERGGGSAFKI